MTALRQSTALISVARLVIACGGKPRDLGTVNHPDEFAADSVWTIVELDGITPAPETIVAAFVEVDADGAGAMVFFTDGVTACRAVAGVDLERPDPDVPTASVRYGMRLGVFGCVAALQNLAIHVPLNPPFQPAS